MTVEVAEMRFRRGARSRYGRRTRRGIRRRGSRGSRRRAGPVRGRTRIGQRF